MTLAGDLAAGLYTGRMLRGEIQRDDKGMMKIVLRLSGSY